METELALDIQVTQQEPLDGGLVADLRRAAATLRRLGYGELATALSTRAEALERLLRRWEHTPPEVWLG